MSDPGARGEVFNLAGLHTYSDPELARYIVERAGSKSRIELIENLTQGMISVSMDNLCRLLEYEPRYGEFLTGLIRRALSEKEVKHYETEGTGYSPDL